MTSSAAHFSKEKAESPHLFGLLPTELHQMAQERGLSLSASQARQVLSHMVSYGQDVSSLRNIAGPTIRSLQNDFRSAPLRIVERSRDPSDGFVKYLFEHEAGGFSEAVRIPLEKAGRYTVCLSSQIGCAMQCVFCATGKLGLSRNLSAWEMVAAFCAVRDEAPGRVSGAVFMGQGEPFHNYDEVIRAAQILSDPCGGRISKEAITISTVGLVPQLHRYADEAHSFRLIVSLTSADAEKRKQLLPVAGRFSFSDLRAALERIALNSKDRITLAWVLMGGLNHGEDEVQKIEREFAGLPIRVNLIDLNTDYEDMRRATDEERGEFIARLHAAGIPTIRRYSGGRSKHAACGMLAASKMASSAIAP